MTKTTPISHETVKNRNTERFRKAYCLFVCAPQKTARPFTDEDIELVTNGLIHSRTSRAYRLGESLPEAWRLLLLVEVLGAGFLNRMVEDFGITGAFDAEGEGPKVPQLNTWMTGLTHFIARAMEDGRMDHQEEAEFKKQLGQLMSQASLYLSEVRTSGKE